MFGLTSSDAAAILAVIMVGYRIGIIDENVINGTIFLILITYLVSSLVTESAGRKIAFSLNRSIKPSAESVHESIIVSLSNPQSMERLLDLARSTLERAGGRAVAAGRKIETVATIDNNVSSGIKRLAREKSATDIIIPDF